MTRDVAAHIRRAAEERILVLDGAWGVLLQSSGLSEQDFRGEQFASHPRDLLNNPDVLNLTRPDVVRAVHERYFAAGADIATTNTFTATSIGQGDYGLEDAVYDLNVAGARIAREVAGDRFVAGSVGPLNITLSLSPRVDEPGFPELDVEKLQFQARRFRRRQNRDDRSDGSEVHALDLGQLPQVLHRRRRRVR